MVIQEMTERECRAMLAGTDIARLACARNNQPYIVPIHVDLDGEFLYGYATLGQKIEWMRQNPLVCLEIDEVITHGQWASVVVFGHYEELPHTPEYEGLREAAERLFERHPMWWEPASVPLAAHEQRTPIVFRIRIDRVIGRRAAPDTVKTVHVQGNASEARRPQWLAQVLRRVFSASMKSSRARSVRGSRTRPGVELFAARGRFPRSRGVGDRKGLSPSVSGVAATLHKPSAQGSSGRGTAPLRGGCHVRSDYREGDTPTT